MTEKCEPDLTPLITQYEVSAVPLDNPSRNHYTLVLKRRPGDRWVVYPYPWSDQAYDSDGNLSWRDPSEQWRRAHWLPFEEAVELAQRLAPQMTVGGYTVEEGIRMGRRRLDRNSAP